VDQFSTWDTSLGENRSAGIEILNQSLCEITQEKPLRTGENKNCIFFLFLGTNNFKTDFFVEMVTMKLKFSNIWDRFQYL
jgi:hypothetical protein